MVEMTPLDISWFNTAEVIGKYKRGKATVAECRQSIESYGQQARLAALEEACRVGEDIDGIECIEHCGCAQRVIAAIRRLMEEEKDDENDNA